MSRFVGRFLTPTKHPCHKGHKLLPASTIIDYMFQGSESVAADFHAKSAVKNRRIATDIVDIASRHSHTSHDTNDFAICVQMTATRQKGTYEIQKQKINQTAYRAEVTNASACHEFRAVCLLTSLRQAGHLCCHKPYLRHRPPVLQKLHLLRMRRLHTARTESAAPPPAQRHAASVSDHVTSAAAHSFHPGDDTPPGESQRFIKNNRYFTHPAFTVSS